MKTNLILCDMCSEEKIAFVDHPNILAGKHLNGSKLHLNPKDDSSSTLVWCHEVVKAPSDVMRAVRLGSLGLVLGNGGQDGG